jgi:hypothetical protein
MKKKTKNITETDTDIEEDIGKLRENKLKLKFELETLRHSNRMEELNFVKENMILNHQLELDKIVRKSEEVRKTQERNQGRSPSNFQRY